MERDGSGLDACEVQQLLRHPQHALRLLVDDGGRPRLLVIGLEAAVSQGLAEADEARQRSFELVRDVGEELPLCAARSLHCLRHAIEGDAEVAYLVRPTNPDAP